jgi:ABC-type nickel/cobalt efflux system permease component RcnA
VNSSHGGGKSIIAQLKRGLIRALFAVIPALLALAAPLAADAHPLGNFTINHLTELSFGSQRADVRYVLDMAEIPTYQTLRAQGGSDTSPAALNRWAQRTAPGLLAQLRLSEGSQPLPLVMDGASARTRPGAGGLPTLYLRIRAHAELPAASSPRAISFRDETYAGRLGWHDVVVAPGAEPTHELTAYPSALLGSPRALTGVDLSVRSDGSATVRASLDDAADSSGTPAGAPLARSNQLSDMLARGTGDWAFVLVTFLVAIALGALHALEPGHGKTLLAISLVGARATVKQAAILAASLTIAHTIGVLALGVAINLFKGYFVPESIYPWITLLSGVAIAIVGARAVQRQILARQPLAHAHAHPHARAHSHDHGHVHYAHAADHGHAHHSHDHASAHDHDHAPAHGHDHAPAHGHGHTHDHDDLEHARLHAIPGTAPLTFGSTIWAAMSGAVAPCPAALVVLLAAVALNQVTYGIFVIVAFSVGLATTLTGLGIAVVRSAGWLQSRRGFERFVRYGPTASAVVISAIGAVMVGQGFAQEGIHVSPLAVTAITALAIAGYAFSHPFAHGPVESAA